MKNENAYEVVKVEKNGIVYDEFLSLSEICGVGMMTEEKIKMLISEPNKKNRNRDVIVLDTFGKI